MTDNGAIYQRTLPSGEAIGVYPMIFTTRLCAGDTEYGYSRAWCYERREDAIAAAEVWDGEGDPPPPWIKEVGTERRRVNGDPALEYDANVEEAPTP